MNSGFNVTIVIPMNLLETRIKKIYLTQKVMEKKWEMWLYLVSKKGEKSDCF